MRSTQEPEYERKIYEALLKTYNKDFKGEEEITRTRLTLEHYCYFNGAADKVTPRIFETIRKVDQYQLDDLERTMNEEIKEYEGEALRTFKDWDHRERTNIINNEKAEIIAEISDLLYQQETKRRVRWNKVRDKIEKLKPTIIKDKIITKYSEN